MTVTYVEDIIDALLDGATLDEVFGAPITLMTESQHAHYFDFDWVHDTNPLTKAEHKQRSQKLNRTLERVWNKHVEPLVQSAKREYWDAHEAKARELGLDYREENMRVLHGGTPHPELPKQPEHVKLLSYANPQAHTVEGLLKKVEKARRNNDHPTLQAASEVLSGAMEASRAVKAQKERITKRLPREGPSKAVQQRKTHGTCSVCGGVQGVPRGIAAHGYRLPWGRGGRTQSCPGAGYPPWEDSPKGAETYLAKLKAHHEAKTKELRGLDTATSINIEKRVGGRRVPHTVHSHEPDFEKHREAHRRNLTGHLGMVSRDIGEFEKKVKDWKPGVRPQPKGN